MSKIPYEIPAEIRDLTAKSVEEARKAFGSFIEAAHKATAQAEGTVNALQSSAKDVSAQALSFTEANLKAVFVRRPHRRRHRSRRTAGLIGIARLTRQPSQQSSVKVRATGADMANLSKAVCHVESDQGRFG